MIGLSIGYLASNQSSYLQAKNFTNTDMLPLSLNPLGGNVGIGTSSPAYRFEVSGSAGDIANFSGNATNSMRIYVGSGYQIFQCYNGTHTNQFGYGAQGQFYVHTAGATRMTINSSGIDVTGTVTSDGLNIDGHIIPGTTDAYDIGSASNVIRNIYTGDLHLSNESKSEGNKVDGTKGNWTMQEGEEHLYIINNKSGKKYRFALEEIQ